MHESTPSTEDSIDARPRPHPRTHHPTSARSRLAKVSLPDVEPAGAELVTWACKEGYVYVPIPPAGTGGHRADRWDVDKWFKALKVELVSIEDDMLVRLSDQETGELFAECPLPSDGTPLTTAVEPVLDSSRYFVLRVVDRGTGKHAFIGLGFRERSDASGFTTGLDEYRKYLLRRAEAERMRQEHEEKEAARAAGGAAGGDGDGAPARDHLALKQNITIPLKAVGSRKAAEGQQPRAGGGAGKGEAEGHAAAVAATVGVAALKLAPPPGSPAPVVVAGGRLAPPPPPPAAGAGAGGGFGARSSGAVSGGGGGGGCNASDDEWGEFTG